MDKKELKKLLKINQKEDRIRELEKLMADSSFWQNRERATKLSQELADLKGLVEEFKEAKSRAELTKLETPALLQGKYDNHNAIVTISAGTGGTDAQDWTEMLLRIYLRFGKDQGWSVKILDKKPGKEAGIKEATLYIVGLRAYGYLKAESGVHRLVRKSPFNSQHLRQTSFALVDVIPEIESKKVELAEKDLKVETFRSSGPGGQSVNTTDSAVRITHQPSGETVSVQNEKSQLQNKRTALKILVAKLAQSREQKEETTAQQARGEVKTAKWGNQIRSYILDPYQQVKDHRTKKVIKDVQAVLDGQIYPFIDSYLRAESR